MSKIAFLFLTIDNLKHPKIWDKFFDEVDKKKYNIYTHPKNANKVTNKLLKSNHLIETPVNTKHGYLVEAMVLLMGTALKDKENKYFIFVSDSCIPIKNFDRVYDDITKKYKTNLVMEMRLKEWNKEARYKGLLSELKRGGSTNNKSIDILPQECLSKFSQWSILTRVSVEKIVKSPYLKFLYKMTAGDEFILSILNCDSKGIYKKFDYKILPSTYVNWELSDNFASQLRSIKKSLDGALKKYNYGLMEKDRLILKDIIAQLKQEHIDIASHPRTFEKITQRDIKTLKETPALFARKFNIDSDILDHIDSIW